MLAGWSWIATIAAGLLTVSRAVVNWHAAIEPNWRIPTPQLRLGVALSAATIAVALTVRQPRWMPRLAAIAAAILLALLVWHPFASDGHPGAREMTAIDAGQGESLFIRFPDGRKILLDGGGIPAFWPPNPLAA